MRDWFLRRFFALQDKSQPRGREEWEREFTREREKSRTMFMLGTVLDDFRVAKNFSLFWFYFLVKHKK